MRGKPQFVQGAVLGAVKASCERLLPRRDLECLRFGFGMVYLNIYKDLNDRFSVFGIAGSISLKTKNCKLSSLILGFQLLLQAGQSIPSRVMRLALAIAGSLVQVPTT